MRVVRAAIVVVALAALASQGSRSGLAGALRPTSQAAMAETPEAAPAPGFLTGRLWRFWPDIEDAARRAGVDPIAWAAVVAAETSGNPGAVGAAGELGLSQYQAGIIRTIGEHCVRRWNEPVVNVRCGALWFARMRRPFAGHSPRHADLLAMVAYHSGNLVWDAERALLAGGDPCDWTDRAYCVTWRDRVGDEERNRSSAKGIAVGGHGVVDPSTDWGSGVTVGDGGRAD